MPWRLLFYLILLGLVLAFVGFNLGHTTDISLGVTTFEDVPVFMSLFVAFFLGVAVAIPIVMQSSSRKTRERTEKRDARRRERAARKDQKAAAQEEKARMKELKRQKKTTALPDSSVSTGVEERPK